MEVDDSDLNILRNPERYLNKLQDENKIVRRDAIKGILSDLKIALGSANCCDGTKQAAMATLLRPITLLIKDPLEKTREVAYELLAQFCYHLRKDQVKELLPVLIPVLGVRLGQPEINEPSEEVRLMGVKLIDHLLQKLGADLNPFIDDLLQIFASTITDPYHKVRVLSCQVTSKVADVCRTVFHYNSDRLLRPLCMSIAHQQLRVRIAVIDCLRQVVLLGNHKGINTILPHITQRVFDPAPSVRLAVVNAVGEWMVNFIDRYSYFPKLVPIILSLQIDDSEEVPKRARVLWEAAGEKYLNENLEQYRDQADFPLPQPAHYPKHIIRSNLGCRIITWQSVHALLPALSTETVDWVKSTRVKATILLYHIILNCEEKITMYVEKIFPMIYRTVRDDEPEVVTYSELAANAIGYFVPLSVTWSILSAAVSTSPAEGNLLLVKAVLAGTDPEILKSFVPAVLRLLNDPDVLECRNNRKNAAILSICQTLVSLVPGRVCEGDTISIYFRIVITTWAQGQSMETTEKAKGILGDLGAEFDLDLDGIMGKFAGKILEEIGVKSSEWTPVSTDKLIFDLILAQGGLAINNNMDQLLSIMLSSLNPQKDPDVRLKFLTRLAQYLVLYSETSTVNKAQLQTFVQHIIEDVLQPNLVWTAGKTAGVLRTAAVSCLMAILESGILLASVITEMAPKILSTIVGVVEDSSEKTRLFSCECLRRLVVESKGGIGAHILHKIYPVMLKRLDDVSDTVRYSALNTIAAVFTNLPADYDVEHYHLYVENVYTTLILHLDDRDERIQDKVQSVLELIGDLRPSSLVNECEKTKLKHRSPTRCEELIAKFTELNAN